MLGRQATQNLPLETVLSSGSASSVRVETTVQGERGKEKGVLEKP